MFLWVFFQQFNFAAKLFDDIRLHNVPFSVGVAHDVMDRT